MENIMTKSGRRFASKQNVKSRTTSGTVTMQTDKSNFPLRLAREGDRVRIVAVRGGKGLRERLTGLGILIGVEVQVLQNSMNGKLLLGHEDKRFYLGGGLSHKIQVAVIEGGEK